MRSTTYIVKVLILFILLSNVFYCCQAVARYRFEVRESSFKRLCKTKSILTVNGQFPGPTLHVHRGDTIIVDVFNKGQYNVTIHWHGIAMTRNPWGDGPEYITQCPIPPGGKFSQKVIFSKEEGTLWWHAHSNWTRATVHGAILVYPKHRTAYPFPKPHLEIPIILGEWWNVDIQTLFYAFIGSGGDPNNSDAYLINGQPGDLYPCSKRDTFRLQVDQGKQYLLRIINSVMQQIMFFGIANHNLTIVGSDGSYTKPFTTSYIVISPGQTIDVLLNANQAPTQYYMAASAYERTPKQSFDNTTTTGIIHYSGNHLMIDSPMKLPIFPLFNDTGAVVRFTKLFRSLSSKDFPVRVPLDITKRLFYTLSMNTFPCEMNHTCHGPNKTQLATSINNVSFVSPRIDLLEAYYHTITGQFTPNFPNNPPLTFNYSATILPLDFETPERGTRVKVLDYNSTVEIVFQTTGLVSGADHPMHLHGYSFYVVGLGLGIFNKDTDPLNFNLVDPPLQNTIVVPYKGWTAIRFRADNPGVWFMHCHLERHATWGMEMAFIVKNGDTPESCMLDPPSDMPKC
ncbi:laccase-14-like [Silene latifolia]|uniref:laccase-14-like n=1 Tax=Silene latifolia TaxID=37657 RepID=UPI003D781410